MRHLLLIVLLGLAACAASPQGAPSLGVDLVCSADDLTQRSSSGAEERMALPISLSVPAQGTAGRFCMATGCEAARIEPAPTRSPGWQARVITQDRSEMNAELEIAPDRSSFRLRRADASGVREWTGACNAAGS